VGGTVLGQFDDFRFKSACVDLAKGDRILFYTDGIIESQDTTGELFGRARLQEFLTAHARLDPRDFLTNLIETVDRFSGSNVVGRQSDDITALMVEV
jgi:serine phosphatase RsbU (regulator of sigma subunit)